MLPILQGNVFLTMHKAKRHPGRLPLDRTLLYSDYATLGFSWYFQLLSLFQIEGSRVEINQFYTSELPRINRSFGRTDVTN